MILWWGFRGFHMTQMNSMVPGTHLGVVICPKPSLFSNFARITSFPRKLQVAPATYLYIPYFPLEGYREPAYGHVLQWPATIVISQNLPAAGGLPPTPGQARVLTGGEFGAIS